MSLRTAFAVARALAYVTIVAYIIAYQAYATRVASPDRDFRFDDVLIPGIVIVVGGVMLFATEMAYQLDLPSKHVFAAISIFVVLAFWVHLHSVLGPPPDAVADCGFSYARVIHAESEDAAHVRMTKNEFGSNYVVWSKAAPEDTRNLTAALGVKFRDDHADYPTELTHLISTYGMLAHYYKNAPTDWIVVLESFESTGARPLDNAFERRLLKATCENKNADVIWLQSSGVARWKITGGIYTGTAGMIYKRTSIPHILDWIDLDNEEARAYGLYAHSDEGYQLYSLNHVLDDGCSNKKIQCVLSAAVVERVARTAGESIEAARLRGGST